MTGGHASRFHLNTLPPDLRQLYFPAAKQPERFQEGMAVKGRNEPCATGGVAWVIAQLKGVPLQEVVDSAFQNTVRVFGMGLLPSSSTSSV
jgi:TatD DNase family protein